MVTRRTDLVRNGPHTHRGSGSTDAHRAKEREQAYDLRIRGLTLRQIADAMRCSHTKVHDLLREEIGNRLDPLREQYTQYELDRLDHMQQATLIVLDNPGRVVTVPYETDEVDPDGAKVWKFRDHVIVDDKKILGAIDRLVRISESRRKLLGLDAPTRVQADVTGDFTVTETTQEDLELQELLREAQARAAAAKDKIMNGGA